MQFRGHAGAARGGTRTAPDVALMPEGDYFAFTE
jgi:hypothetical protein